MKPIFPVGTVFISPGYSELRRGRPPLNGIRAMTSAERSKRNREKRNADKVPRVLPPCPGLIPGSLTTQISSDSFVRRYIDTYFPNLKDIARACNRRLREQGLAEQKRIHEHSVVAMLVGTAIDYRIRAYFRRDLHRSSAVERGLLFLQALPQYRKVTSLSSTLEQVETAENVWHRARREKVAAKFIASFKKFVADLRPERRRLTLRSEERLCRYCILFAYLDSIGRAPFANSALENIVCYGTPNIQKMLSYVDRKIVADVVALSRMFSERNGELIAKFRKVTIGGNLAGSADVGGADFDLLVDGCLIDFKATRKPLITTVHLRQLIGYWLLDYDDALKIRSIAVYLVRHGHMELFDIRKELLQNDTLPVALRAKFRKEIKKLRRTQKFQLLEFGGRASN